jgi:hypothetical protein
MITARSSIPSTVKVAISDDAGAIRLGVHGARPAGGATGQGPQMLVETDAVRGRTLTS